jgi:hypothetical protein
LGETKAVASMALEPGGGEAMDQLDLDRGGDRLLFVLQAVARPDFDDAYFAGEGHSVLAALFLVGLEFY